ncbi:MAG TPA: SRPBCC family protein [Acidimicrobiales bacterium]|jgi:uncharacterized membrane protein
MEYRTSIEIDAPLETVWGVLTDLERWPEWTKSIQQIAAVSGSPLTPGAKIRIKQPRLPAAVWEVTQLEPDRVLTWKAKSGSVTTVADHRLSISPAKKVVADLSIRQTGTLAWLAGLFTSSLSRRYVEMEAEGLKHRSEIR